MVGARNPESRPISVIGPGIPVGHRLWSTPNLIISPHTSADDPATYNKFSLDIFLDNLRAWRDGRPLPNRFDIARGY